MPDIALPLAAINGPQLQPGEVALVGAGPGDPGLLTLHALHLLQQAEVVVYDRLVSDAIMNLLPATCRKLYVGKAAADHSLPQPEINQLLIRLARDGLRTLRLKGGDPFIFGRGGEEVDDLQRAGIYCHVVPGITAASGCSTYAGFPLTHRDHAQSCTLVTGHLKSDGDLELNWQALAAPGQTLVFYMGLHSAAIISQRLQQAGMAAETPIAIIERGTTPEQRLVRGTLARLPQLAQQQQIQPPSLLVIGSVTGLDYLALTSQATEALAC